mgnify:CR=1 FL=1
MMWGVPFFVAHARYPMPEISQMTDEELVAIPEKTRDGNLATTATLEMLRRLKESVDNLLAAIQAKA